MSEVAEPPSRHEVLLAVGLAVRTRTSLDIQRAINRHLGLVPELSTVRIALIEHGRPAALAAVQKLQKEHPP